MPVVVVCIEISGMEGERSLLPSFFNWVGCVVGVVFWRVKN